MYLHIYVPLRFPSIIAYSYAANFYRLKDKCAPALDVAHRLSHPRREAQGRSCPATLPDSIRNCR